MPLACMLVAAFIRIHGTPTSHPVILELPPLIAERPEAICANTGQTIASHLLEALDWYFDKIREARAAEEVLEMIRAGAELTRSLDDVAADFGLK